MIFSSLISSIRYLNRVNRSTSRFKKYDLPVILENSDFKYVIFSSILSAVHK